MHELALARAVAGTVRAQRWERLPLEVRVRGGHGDPEAFEASLLAHLRSQAPELFESPIRVVHLPAVRMCASCTTTYLAGSGADCPACGGIPLPLYAPEEVEVVLDLPEEDCRCV